MENYKCKCCGRILRYEETDVITTCEDCDTMQTLPHMIEDDTTTDTQILLKYIAKFLLCSEWKDASKYCTRILDNEPDNMSAVIYMLMIEYKANTFDNLGDGSILLSESNYYQKAMRILTDIRKEKLEEYNQKTIENLHEKRKCDAYIEAVSFMKEANSEQKYLEAVKKFKALEGYSSSFEKMKECEKLAERAKREREVEKQRERELIKIMEKKALKRKIISLSLIGVVLITVALVIFVF